MRQVGARKADESSRCAHVAAVYRDRVLRNALRPRWLALLALALALASVFAWLGSWQLDRARSESGSGAAEATDGSPVPLDDLLSPQEALTSEAALATVEVTGELEPDRAVLVADRDLDGRSGRWLVAPLVVDRARLPVVLGWLAADEEVPPSSDLPTGGTTFTGRLQISEAPVGLPADGEPLAALSSADLVNDWGAPVYAAYLLAAEPVAGLTAVPVPETEGGAGLALQNLSYAMQWWVFAAFAVFLWWRVVRDDHLDRQHASTVPEITRSATP